MRARLFGFVVGALLGAFFGAGTGIASGGEGYNGIWVFTPLFALMGFFATPDFVRLWQRMRRFWGWAEKD